MEKGSNCGAHWPLIVAEFSEGNGMGDVAWGFMSQPVPTTAMGTNSAQALVSQR